MAPEDNRQPKVLGRGSAVSLRIALPVMVGLLGLAFVGGLLVGRSISIQPATLVASAPAEEEKIAYSFETGPEGWSARSIAGSQACLRVGVSSEQAKDGKSSLRLEFELRATDSEKRKGEAFVKLPVPKNLNGRFVTAWVYAPVGARGDDASPNGFQLFVKDTRDRAEYGSWLNVREGEWMQLELPVAASEPPGGYMDRGFEPHRVSELGLKMGAGEGGSSSFKGVVYLDAVAW